MAVVDTEYVEGTGIKNAAYTKDTGHLSLSNVSGHVDEHVMYTQNGGVVMVGNGSTLTSGLKRRKTSSNDFGIVAEGYAEPAERAATISDDWGDGRLSDRITPRKNYRPEWSVSNGTPAATDGVVTFPAADAGTHGIETDSFIRTGHCEIDFSFNTVPTSGQFRFWPMMADNGDYWMADLTGGGRFRINKTENGTYTNPETVSWTQDTNRHTLRLVRSPDIDGAGNAGVTVYLDGASAGPVIDPFVPSTSTISMQNNLDVAVNVHNIRVEER